VTSSDRSAGFAAAEASMSRAQRASRYCPWLTVRSLRASSADGDSQGLRGLGVSMRTRRRPLRRTIVHARSAARSACADVTAELPGSPETITGVATG
jgi:hypothetical protein